MLVGNPGRQSLLRLWEVLPLTLGSALIEGEEIDIMTLPPLIEDDGLARILPIPGGVKLYSDGRTAFFEKDVSPDTVIAPYEWDKQDYLRKQILPSDKSWLFSAIKDLLLPQYDLPLVGAAYDFKTGRVDLLIIFPGTKYVWALDWVVQLH